MSSASCRSIDNTHVKLYSDSTCTTDWTDTSKLYLAEDVSNEFKIKVESSVPQITSAYVGETTLGNVKACKQYDFEVCGTEIVSVNDTSAWLSYK
jgi:hypothetical protein